MLYLILAILGIFVLLGLFSKDSEAIGNWSHLFENMNHDPIEFYKLVGDKLKENEVPELKYAKKNFNQGGILSQRREYFEIHRKNLIFHLCACPWGKGFFFSWWIREELSTAERIFSKVPFIGPPIVRILQYKSYYHWDTETMFRKSVHQSVLDAIDQLTTEKGIRGLTELERQPTVKAVLKK